MECLSLFFCIFQFFHSAKDEYNGSQQHHGAGKAHQNPQNVVAGADVQLNEPLQFGRAVRGWKGNQIGVGNNIIVIGSVLICSRGRANGKGFNKRIDTAQAQEKPWKAQTHMACLAILAGLSNATAAIHVDKRVLVAGPRIADSIRLVSCEQE